MKIFNALALGEGSGQPHYEVLQKNTDNVSQNKNTPFPHFSAHCYLSACLFLQHLSMNLPLFFRKTFFVPCFPQNFSF
jgi:hypothetical protein